MKILCATDLLPKSDAAIERAGLLGDQLGADVTLLHVVGLADSEGVLEGTLQGAQEQMRSRGRAPLWRWIGVPSVVLAGNPARLILDALRQSKPELLVAYYWRSTSRPLRRPPSERRKSWSSPLSRMHGLCMLARPPIRG